MADSPERARSYFISSGQATEGPFDLASLRDQVASGRLNAQFQIWDDDAGNWAPFSVLEDLLRTPPEATGRVRPVRAPKIPSYPQRDASAGAAGGAALSEAELLKVLVPRVVSQRTGGTYGAEPPTPTPVERPPEREQPPSAAPEPAPSPRRRIYSPMSAGANVARPFSPVKAPTEEPAVEVESTPPPAETPGPVESPIERRAIWPVAGVCIGACVLGLLALRIGGLMTFGVHVPEENLRLRDELAATKERLAVKERDLKSALAEKEDYSRRFALAQTGVRNIRSSLFAATKRELQLGNTRGVDQRLYELDQLSHLASENEEEQKVRHELTDAYFGVRAADKPPSSEAEASPAP